MHSATHRAGLARGGYLTMNRCCVHDQENVHHLKISLCWLHTGRHQVVYRLDETCLLNNSKVNDRLHIYPLIRCLISPHKGDRRDQCQTENTSTSQLCCWHQSNNKVAIPVCNVFYGNYKPPPPLVTLHNVGPCSFAKLSGTLVPLAFHHKFPEKCNCFLKKTNH